MSSIELTPPMPGKNKYIVWNAATQVFDEFPIKLGEVQVGSFLEIIIAPPVMRAGFLSYKKQIFHLSLHDLLRNHFNVNRPYAPTTATTTIGRLATDVGKQSENNTNELGPETSPRNELDEESSLYWQEQMQSLLNSKDPEEGWFLEETTQP